MKQSLQNKLVLFVLIFFSCIQGGYTQEIDAERLFEYNEDGDNNNVFLDYLSNLQQQPLDLNKVSLEDLYTIPWITQDGALAVLQYRREHGEFRHIDELDRITALQPATELIKTFFMVKQKKAGQYSLSGRHRLASQLQQSRGYKENIYAGNSVKAYNKVNGSLSNQIRFALVTEKDPGESSYYDYYGGYGEWLVPKLHSKLVLGNFFVESGQGLVHHGAYRISKGYEPVMAAVQPGRGIKGAASVAENNGYCGGGILTTLGNMEIGAFYSARPLDANVENNTIITFSSSGYHRYGSEIKNRDAVTETVYGGYLKLPVTQNFYLGVQGLAAFTDKPFIIERPATRITGDSYRVFSVDYRITRSAWQVFGECARSTNSGINQLHGIRFNRQGFEYLVLWRNYQPDFLNWHGGAFGESSDMANEKGIYSGWKWRPDRKTTLACYYDYYKRPYYDNSDLSALQSKEIMFIVEHKFNNCWAGLLRGQWRNRDELYTVKDEFGNFAKKIVSQIKYLLRVQLDFQPQKNLQLRSRFEYHRLGGNDYGLSANLDDSSAVMLYHDIHYTVKERLFFRTRWTLFDSPLYDTAFYLYENDLPGVMRMKMLYHRGSRWYILAGLKLKKHLQITAKYEQTVYDNVDSIGSGYDLVTGDHENVISLQVDWRL